MGKAGRVPGLMNTATTVRAQRKADSVARARRVISNLATRIVTAVKSKIAKVHRYDALASMNAPRSNHQGLLRALKASFDAPTVIVWEGLKVTVSFDSNDSDSVFYLDVAFHQSGKSAFAYFEIDQGVATCLETGMGLLTNNDPYAFGFDGFKGFGATKVLVRSIASEFVKQFNA
jgi:hypothetical protein